MSPENLIRDLPLIRRRARENEAEDYSFRTYLKTKLPLSNAELDTLVKETTDAVWAHISCTECAQCCRLQIVVDEKDIRRLAAHLKLPVPVFARQYVSQAEDGVLHFTSAPCPFLGADNFCTVYEHRPRACRDYPYLYDKHFRTRTLTMIENTRCCPIVFNVWQELKTQLAPSVTRPRKPRRNNG